MVAMTPGIEWTTGLPPRGILRQASRQLFYARPVTLDATNSYDGGQATGTERQLQAGTLLAIDAVSRLWMPVKRTKTSAAGTGTSVAVDEARFFRAGDSVVIGTAQPVNIVSVNYLTKTLTLSASRAWGKSSPVVGSNGRGTARAILLDDHVSLMARDGATPINGFAQALQFGIVERSKILGDLTACLEDPAHGLGGIIFDDHVDGVDPVPIPPAQLAFFQHTVADLAADADLAETVILASPLGCQILDITLTPLGNAAGIDASNLSVWTFRRGVAGTTVLAKQFSAANPFPLANAVTSLALPSPILLAPGEVLTLQIANGTTADTPSCVVSLVHRIGF